MDAQAADPASSDEEATATSSPLEPEIAGILAGAHGRDPADIARDIAALVSGSLQRRTHEWMMRCFGPTIANNREERGNRFLEEAIELVQACDMPPERAHRLVDYVYGRPVGERRQEVGGVELTLTALCTAYGIDKTEAVEAELARAWLNIDKIRLKQAAKPSAVLGMEPSHSGERLDPGMLEHQEDLRVGFVYRNWRGELAERRVEIRGLWYGSTEWHPEPQWFLKAIDLDKHVSRDFALRDIMQPAPAPEVADDVISSGI
ncbi:hypothetical protein [Acidiphilium sp. C61]|uniref:hypothetical protein n=1 Tax=Acidiphilium sp. C61 TaxID=1671485 RepID=UPI00191A2992|nr:hypothetical protein [Acidiphilium sp. C61]